MTSRQFDEMVARRWAQPDSSRDFILAHLKASPGVTVLDIGCGTGAWTMYLAPHARHVTGVDPSPAMLKLLREKLAASDVSNVAVVQGAWPAVEVAPHDIALCSHAMYMDPDFAAFVRRMTAVARRRCYMLLRAPTPDGVMAEAARHLWGQPYDSPNFQVAYNALLQMGIFAHVLMEDTGLWKPWIHDSFEEALSEIKRRFGVSEDGAHEAFLRDLLERRLTSTEKGYVWPRKVRSALVYWDV